MLASSLINDALVILNDTDATRWSRSELLRWLNQGQLQITQIRPDVSVFNGSLTLVDGYKQSIPASGLRVLDVESNTSGRSVKLTTKTEMDAINATWRASSPSNTVKHYMIDERDPKRFYVYPPALAGASVEVIYSVPPVEISAESESIFNDILANQIFDWMLYRAYQKDADYEGNAARSQTHLGAFMTAMGAKSQTDIAFSPKE